MMQSSVTTSLCLTLSLGLSTISFAQIGGRCEYDRYPGEAKITAVAKHKPIDEFDNRTGFDVHFKFTPAKNTKVPKGARVQVARKQTFTFLNGQPLTQKYIDAYKIKIGNTYPAHLEVIRKGTCTPIMFDLQGLDPIDYDAKGPRPKLK